MGPLFRELVILETEIATVSTLPSQNAQSQRIQTHFM